MIVANFSYTTIIEIDFLQFIENIVNYNYLFINELATIYLSKVVTTSLF